MNVGELREALEEFSDDVPVLVRVPDEDWLGIDYVALGLSGAETIALVSVDDPASPRGGDTA